MDTKTNYQKIVCELFKEYELYLSRANGIHNQTIEPETIFDLQNNHFQLLLKGWKGYQQIFRIAFHIDIIENKVWIQQNNTEFRIADELIEKGIPKTDIVLGFISPKERAYTDFAVA